MHKLKPMIITALLLPILAVAWAENATAEDYQLGTGDKLRIKVQEWPDMSGEYFVSPAATVSLSMVGELQAGGKTTSELAKTICDRLQATAKLVGTPSCTVEVVGFRPFFVMGDVQKPGEYAYRPGLTVLQAVSVAGGYYRPTDTAFRLERDAISARGNILLRAKQAKELVAKIARLEAEQQNAKSISFPQELDATAGSPDAALMEDERRIFEANNSGLADTLATLDHAAKLYNQEVEAIEAQIASEKRQLAAVNEEFDSIQKLAEKGLTSLSRRLTLERTIAQIEATVQGLQANILRARQNISETEQRRLDTLNSRTDRVNRELQEARAKSKETAFELKTARNLLFEAEVVAPALYARDSEGSVQPKFTIARKQQDGQVKELTADSATPVLPGDVLTVDRRSMLSRQESGGLQPSRFEASANQEPQQDTKTR
jgi:protein involved in polysaccharide export with SLBB domain